jgi:branched-chain amino acid transport system substrate-binding protein
MALAISKIALEKNRLLMVNAASSDVTGSACTANTVQWTLDTYGSAHTAVPTVLSEGSDSWFFVTADYNFGYALVRDASAVVVASGGKVLGAVRAPIGTSDFSSFLLQAQSTHPKVLALANGGGDAETSLRQAVEFQLPQSGTRLVALNLQINGAHGLGLKVGQGLLVADQFYWDLNDGTRAFAKKFEAKMGRMPSSVQADDYAMVTHYLKAVEAAGTDETKAVLGKMREMPVADGVLTKNGQVRADGRVVYDTYLFQMKTPEESKGEWDLYKLVKTVPASEAFRPLSESVCPLVKK